MELECLAFFLYYLFVLNKGGIWIDDTFVFNFRSWLMLAPDENFFALTSVVTENEKAYTYHFDMEDLIKAAPIANKLRDPYFYVKLLDHVGEEFANAMYASALDFYSYTWDWTPNYGDNSLIGRIKQ